MAITLLVIRHAIAEDKDAFARTGRPDGERPLTKRGRVVAIVGHEPSSAR